MKLKVEWGNFCVCVCVWATWLKRGWDRKHLKRLTRGGIVHHLPTTWDRSWSASKLIGYTTIRPGEKRRASSSSKNSRHNIAAFSCCCKLNFIKCSSIYRIHGTIRSRRWSSLLGLHTHTQITCFFLGGGGLQVNTANVWLEMKKKNS